MARLKRVTSKEGLKKPQQSLMKKALTRIIAVPNLSKNVYELVSKALSTGEAHV